MDRVGPIAQADGERRHFVLVHRRGRGARNLREITRFGALGQSVAAFRGIGVQPAHETHHRVAIRFDDVMRDLAIERIAQRVEIDQARPRIGGLQHRPVATAAQALPEHLGPGVQVEHRAAFPQPRARSRTHHGTATRRQHDAGQLRELGDDRLFTIAEAGLALDLEDRRDADAQPRFELVVGVDETLVESLGERPPERGLSRAHQPDQKQIAPM